MTHHLGGKQLERHGPKLCHSRSALQAKPCTQCDCKSVEICIKNLRIYCDFETCLYCWIISGVVLAGPTEILGSEWNLFHSFLRTVSEWNLFHSFLWTVSEWNRFHSFPRTVSEWNRFHAFPRTVSEWNLFHSFLRTVSEWNRFHSFPRTVSEWNRFHSFPRTVSEWNLFHSFPCTVSEWNLFHSWSLRMEPLPLLPPYSPWMELFHSFPSTVSEWNLTRRRRRRRRLFTAESVWSTEFPITCSQFKLLGSLVYLKFTAYAGWASSS